MAPKPPKTYQNLTQKSHFLHKKSKKYLYFGTKNSNIKFLSLNLIKHKNIFNLSQI